jgi:hypothetical protein
MAGLDPAIHVFLAQEKQDVDAPHKAGHDENRVWILTLTTRNDGIACKNFACSFA